MYEIKTRFHMIPISWICGFGAYWELFARGGCFTWKFTGKMEVDPHSTAKFSILVDLRVWGLLGTICWGGVVLHGNLQVKWRPTHIPQQNFQFWWICGFGAYWELFDRGGCFTWKFTGKMEVDPHSTAKFSILVDLRVWGLLGTIC